MVEYKQNHQRSISSYTTHALCVKAAFHVGLHSRIPIGSGRPGESYLRLRLWDGVVKNDREVFSSCGAIQLANNGRRVMSLTQGRPFMIPQAIGTVNNEVPREANPTTSDLYMTHLA